MNPTLLFLGAGLVALMAAANAQGTAQDYERANSLGRRIQGKIFRSSVRPNWIGDAGKFWYRNDLPEGKREFILVDPSVPSKVPAFDSARLAISLSKVLNRPVSADRLPIDTIAFVSDKPVLNVQVQNKTYECDLKTYDMRLSDQPPGNTSGLAADTGPRASRDSSEETSVTFLNKMNEEVSLFWLDTGAQRHPYGTIKPGEKHEQHTFAGHVWLAAHKDGRPIAVYEAQAIPEIAVIDGTVMKTPVPIAGRTRRRRAQGSAGAERKFDAIIRDNNVVLIDRQTKQETVLTKDGSPGDSYENNAVWSPDGTKFVLYKTIPAQEHKVSFVESSPKDQEQPKLHTIDYLKPGDKIAHPRPHLFDATAQKEIPVKDDLFPNPWELSELHWEPDGKRFTFLYNQRGHQVMRLIGVDAATGEAKSIIDEQAKTFIDWTNKVFLHTMDQTHEAIWMSERDGWNHLYLVDTRTGAVKNQITKGAWVVRKWSEDMDHVDEQKRQIWFRAGGIYPGQDPYYIHYCRINFDGTGLTVLTAGDGTHKIDYSPDHGTYIDSYSRVDMPPVTELRRTADGKKLLDLEKGDASAVYTHGWQMPERFAAKGRDGRTDIYGVIVRPSNFDPARKYPVLENIYAGPQDSFVPKAFSPAAGLQQMAELGFIVVQIDGMGTNNRSKAFHDVCWKNLADAGFPDRILWIKAAGAKYPSMDLTRVGIYGTSAGGQNALGGLLLHGDFYKAGVADCGCHDNRMDKMWWNEQWMGWPVGPHYAEQSNVTLAPNLKGKLLLMVGEMDTNVDPATTMQVVNALVKSDKDFDLLVLPGAGHGVAGTPYGRRRLQDFFVRNLLGVEPRN